MAFIAYHLHWSHAELMNLDHSERRRWCTEVSAINKQLNSTGKRDKGPVTLESLI